MSRRAKRESAPFPWPVLLAVPYLALSLWLLFLTPIGHAPDESAHLVYVRHLVAEKRLPVFRPERPGVEYEFHQPPLYYALAAPLYERGLHRSPEQAARLARLPNVVLGLVLIWLTYAFVRELLPGRPWIAAGAAGFVAYLPMNLYLSATVNNDILTQVWFAAALVVMARALRTGLTLPRAALLGAVAGLSLLTKSIAVWLVPLGWIAVLLARRREGGTWARVAIGAAVFTAVALAVGGWWLVRNVHLYGDPLATRAFSQAFLTGPLARPTPWGIMQYLHLSDWDYAVRWFGWWSYRSFWGMFGPTGSAGQRFIFLPNWIYALLGAMTALALAGLLRARRERLAAWQLETVGVGVLVLVLLGVGYIGFNLMFFQAQARYLFPALPVIGLGFSAGFSYLFGRDRAAIGPAAILLILAAALPSWLATEFST